MIKIKGNIILLGTSHVSKESQILIGKTITKYSPKVVGIELDINRFKSLMSNSKKKKNPKFSILIKHFGLTGALFAIFAGHFQKKIGEKLNIEPGIDMKTAYNLSRKLKIPVSLIDIDIKKTMKKISNISFLKKISLFSKLIYKSLNPKYTKKYKFDIKKGLPSENTLLEIFKLLKNEFPQIYNILIEDRNRYMVKKLLKLRENHSNGYILAVVGAGHVPGMYNLLDKHLIEDSHTIIDRTFRVNLEKL